MRLKALQQRQKEVAAEGRTLTAIAADQRSADQVARLTAIVSEGGELDRFKAELDAELRLVDAERALIADTPALAAVTHDNAADKPWPAFGSYLQAVRRAHSGGGIDVRLAAAASGMNEAVGTDGGYAVPVEYGGGIERTMWETGQILSRVSARPISGNAITFNVMKETSRADGSRRGAVLGYWIDEAGAPDPSAIKLAQVELKLRKVAALGYMTEELLEDAPALDAELTEAFAEELQFQVENKIFRGAGSTVPLGFMNAPCLVTQAKDSQSARTIITTNLSAMWARLPARSKANAVWLINVDCEPQLDELTIPAGVGAVEPRFVNYGPTGLLTIKGRPVIPVEYCETLGTVGDIVLADLSQYRLVRKNTGVQQSSSIHVRFANGENTFRAIYRVDGQPLPRAAITPFKGTNTLSPFVALATRA